MRLRSGRITRPSVRSTRNSRRLPTYQDLNRQYRAFDFPTPRRHRIPSAHSKSVSVRVHRRRMPLSRRWRDE